MHLRHEPKLERQDDRELGAKILALTQSEARELGIGKSTLHYLRKKAASNSEFRITTKILAKFSSRHTSNARYETFMLLKPLTNRAEANRTIFYFEFSSKSLTDRRHSDSLTRHLDTLFAVLHPC